jgi:hypothetical protein
VAKDKKWAFLRGKLPSLGADPEYAEVIGALRARYAEMTIQQVIAAWNRCSEKKAKLNQDLSEVNADLVAFEALVKEYLEREQMESIECEGVRLTRSPEPVVKVVDKAKLMAWVEEHYPEMISIHHSTLLALTKDALTPRPEGQEQPPIPEGVEIDLYEAVSRRKTGGRSSAVDEQENVA